MSVKTEGRKRTAKAQYERDRRAQNAAEAAAAPASASSPASSSPAAASTAAASPGASTGADVDIGSIEDEDGNLLSVLLPHEKKSRAEIKAAATAKAAKATVALRAKAAAKRAEAALPVPGTRRSPACCSRFPPLTLI